VTNPLPEIANGHLLQISYCPLQNETKKWVANKHKPNRTSLIEFGLLGNYQNTYITDMKSMDLARKSHPSQWK
jgi:hypothetical protein